MVSVTALAIVKRVSVHLGMTKLFPVLAKNPMAIDSREILLLGTDTRSVQSWSERLRQIQIPVRPAVGREALADALRHPPTLAVCIVESESSLELAALCAKEELSLLLVLGATGADLLMRSRALRPLGYCFPRNGDEQVYSTVLAGLGAARERQHLRAGLHICHKRNALSAEAEAIAGLGVWEWNQQADTVRCSLQAARIFGLEPNREVPTNTFLRAFALGHRPEAAEQLAVAAREGSSVRFEASTVHPESAGRIIELQARPYLPRSATEPTLIGTVRDVTVRSELREALARRAEQLQTILDNIPVLVAHYDREGRVLRLNRTAEQALGWSGEEARRINFLAACLPDPDYRREIWDFMRSTRGWRDVKLTTKTGTVLDTAWTSMRLADGTRLGFGVDITERKRRERQLRRLNMQRRRALRRLRERERQFEHVAENSPDIISRIDREFRHVYVNPTIELVTGMNRKHFLGKTNRELGMPEDKAAVWEAQLAAVFRTGEARRFEFTFTDLLGKEHTYESSLVPERGPDGQVRTALSIARDITAHAELERSLRESVGLFRQLTEHIDEVFWLTTWPEISVVYVSPAFERVWGRPADQLQDNPMLWVESIVEEERHHVEEAFLRTAGTGGYDITFRIRRPDGEVRWIRDRGFVIRNSRNEVYRIAGVALDITALKRIQTELQKSIKDIAEAKRAADSANEQLSQANEKLSHLSREDPLTGVGNRRFLEEFVQREWRRERRQHHEVALIMADVDHFKAYNDGYGHAAGDDCLRQVAQALSGELHRPADILARYGGEEFCAVLPETDLGGAARLAELMRGAVESISLPHGYSSASDVVTLSFGVAVGDPAREEFRDLLSRADASLYLAKTAGRNRVGVAHEPEGDVG